MAPPEGRTVTVDVIHTASRDEESGRVQFTLKAGDAILVGQVASEEEYRQYVTAFQAWNRVKLPRPSERSWSEAID